MPEIPFSDLPKFLARLGKNKQAQMRKAAKGAAQRGVSFIVRVAIPNAQPHAPFDRGLYSNSWKDTPIPKGHRLYSDSPYAGIIEWGRRPGAWPPIQPIREWVYRKMRHGSTRGKGAKTWTRKNTAKGGSQESELNSIAFLIARHIKEHGIPPKHILAGSVKTIRGYFSEELRELIQKEG